MYIGILHVLGFPFCGCWLFRFKSSKPRDIKNPRIYHTVFSPFGVSFFCECNWRILITEDIFHTSIVFYIVHSPGWFHKMSSESNGLDSDIQADQTPWLFSWLQLLPSITEITELPVNINRSSSGLRISRLLLIPPCHKLLRPFSPFPFNSVWNCNCSFREIVQRFVMTMTDLKQISN